MTVRPRLVWIGVPALAATFLFAPGRNGEVVPLSAAEPKADKTYDEKIKPFLNKYCNTCHNSDKQAGGVALDVYKNEAHARKDRMTWETVQKLVAAGEMPPKKKDQPTKDEKEHFLGWIENSLTKVDCTAPKDPGRVTLRRLNRAEYNNTVRDLCGVRITPADDFPSDDVGYGFDNIGDVLSLQPILLEKYLAAADRVLDAAIVPLEAVPSSSQVFRPQNLTVEPRSARLREMVNGREVRRIEFTVAGTAYQDKLNFPATGDYLIRVKAWGQPAGGEAPKLSIRVHSEELKAAAVDAPRGKPVTVEVKARIEHGEKRVEAAFLNPSEGADKPRTLGVETIEVEGPIGGAPRPLPESTRMILVQTPKTPADAPSAARAVLMNFARRAFRRPATPAEVDRLMNLYALAVGQGDSFEKAIRLPLKAVLVSPHFLFRIEDDPKAGEDVRTLDDHELAARLSYFVWSSMPDDELSRVADRGDLRKPGVLKAQVERMLRDPKSSALVDNFAGQWLMLRSLRTQNMDPGTYKGWDEQLRSAMIRETELFFDHVVKNDRSVLDFLDSDYTFVNGRLAQHYGMKDVFGRDFRMVKLTDRRRGGLLTQASILTVTSNPTRTSPVKRGKWVYENILGLTAPPPAPDVPELEKVTLKGSVRQQMEQHRSNPACATCHAKLDPLGFGLENFDGIGAWRETDNTYKIDASGVLPDGAKFDGPAQLRKVLVGKADQFRRCLAEKLFTFALGRGLEYYDRCAVDEQVAKLKSGSDKFSALVLAIAESDAFQKRKGKRSE
jgi:hypothetical protein